MTRPRKAKAPVPGASRVYVLTPVTAEDAYAWAAARQTAKGWEVIDDRTGLNDPHPTHSAWVMVELWAIPPAA
jgi:hypothetical protein